MNPDVYVDGLLRALVDFDSEDPYDEFLPLEYLSGECGLSAREATAVLDYAHNANFMDSTRDYLANGTLYLCVNAQILPHGIARLNPSEPEPRINISASDNAVVQVAQGGGNVQSAAVLGGQMSEVADLLAELRAFLVSDEIEDQERDAAVAAIDVLEGDATPEVWLGPS